MLALNKLKDVEADILLYSLKQRYGYDFGHYAKASLTRRLEGLKKSYQVDHLTELVTKIVDNEDFAQEVVNLITVPVSSFFRDALAWQHLRNTVLPQLASYPFINIWQAGCSRGEETYTLQILLHEAGLLHKTRTMVSDINPSLLSQTKAGCYSQSTLEEGAKNYALSGNTGSFSDYFIERYGKFEVIDALRQNVEFFSHNLAADNAFIEANLIVCRNVLIYFNNELQQRVISLFNDSLSRGGYLFLGSAETIIGEDASLECLDFTHRLYQKAWRTGHV